MWLSQKVARVNNFCKLLSNTMQFKLKPVNHNISSRNNACEGWGIAMQCNLNALVRFGAENPPLSWHL